MTKISFFCHGVVFSKDGKDRYITVGDGFRVDGGTKEDHRHMVELTSEASKQFNENQPQTIHEAAEILSDVIKKVGKPSRLG